MPEWIDTVWPFLGDENNRGVVEIVLAVLLALAGLWLYPTG